MIEDVIRSGILCGTCHGNGDDGRGNDCADCNGYGEYVAPANDPPGHGRDVSMTGHSGGKDETYDPYDPANAPGLWGPGSYYRITHDGQVKEVASGGEEAHAITQEQIDRVRTASRKHRNQRKQTNA
jgi:hypothetical protein